MERSYSKTHGRSEWEHKGKLMLEFGMGSGSFEAQHGRSQKEEMEKLRTQTGYSFEYHGGIASSIHDDWQTTVAHHPVMLHAKLRPLYEIVKDTTMQRQLKKAHDIYLEVDVTGFYLPTSLWVENYPKRCITERDCLYETYCSCKHGYNPATECACLRDKDDIPHRRRKECDFIKNGICNNGRCECPPDRFSIWSISLMKCLIKCDDYDDLKFIEHPKKGFIDHSRGPGDSLLNTSPAKCAMKCNEYGQDSCLSFVFINNENRCQLLPYSLPQIVRSSEGSRCKVFITHGDDKMYCKNAHWISDITWEKVSGHIEYRDNIDLYKRVCL